MGLTMPALAWTECVACDARIEEGELVHFHDDGHAWCDTCHAADTPAER